MEWRWWQWWQWWQWQWDPNDLHFLHHILHHIDVLDALRLELRAPCSMNSRAPKGMWGEGCKMSATPAPPR